MPGDRVEVVRERLDEAGLGDELVEFWVSHRALNEAEARERIPAVICILRDGDGRIAGANSAAIAIAPLVGRPMWIYRRFIGPGVGEEEDLELLRAAVGAMAEGFTGDAGEPIGVCVTLSDQALMARRPEAVWPDPEFVFAGYTPKGVQVRLHYFEGARI